MARTTSSLSSLAKERTIILTTYRRDGKPVETVVHVAADGDRAYVRTWDTSWKAKRLRNNPSAEVRASSDTRPIGGPMPVAARLLEGGEARCAGRLLTAKYPVMHRLIPLFHRLTGKRTIHYELTLREDAQESAA